MGDTLFKKLHPAHHHKFSEGDVDADGKLTKVEYHKVITTLRIKQQPDFRCSSLGSLETGEIPVKCHGLAYGRVLPRILGMGGFQAAVSF